VSTKSIAFKTPTAPLPGAEQWVEARIAPIETVAMKRLTLDVPAEVHRRLKVHCASTGLNMAELCRALIVKALAADAA
jgi:hypothetical protein